MANVLKELLRIKDFRESQAEMHMLKQRSVALEAQQKHEREQIQLEHVRREGQETERRLYGDLCERVVRLKDIENVQYEVSCLRERESLQEQAVISAREVQEQAEQALTTAKSLHQEAHRQKTKFEDLSREFDQTAASEAEKREDLELEEVAGFRRDREDWEEPIEEETNV